jgi:serine/threonine-protein kinase/endoribonuclease IRE1
MRRRGAGVGTVVVSALAATLIALPFFVNSEQHQHEYKEYIKPLDGGGPLINEQLPSGRPRIDHDGKQIERRDPKDVKEELSNSRRANNAIATTEAPAGINPAVRAPRPVRGSSRHAGISSPHSARSLQDWEVEDFVLLATVDGSIHARDRNTGAPRWELQVEKPMVETRYYPQNQSNSESRRAEYDFLWIVEPSRDGDIYVYNPNGNGLQKLHLTVKQLAEDMSPYESVDPAVVYNAEKKTKLYTIDAATGKITKIFGTAGTFGKSHQSCPKSTGLEGLDEEECAPSASFVLGRTEYIITIQNRDTTEPICTLMYSEWGPNNRDEDLHSQYSTTMDQKYVYSLHDGRIFGLDYSQLAERQRSYTQKLSSPVARVFDVARPLGMHGRDPQFIILQQPIRPVYDGLKPNAFIDRNRIFVNHTEAGGWFAMSETTYPLVTGRAQLARCYDKNWLESKSPGNLGSDSYLREAFVGVHDISEFEPWQGSGLTLSAPSPQAEAVDNLPATIYAEPSMLPSLSIIGRSRIIGSAAENATDIIIAIMFIIMAAFLGINRGTLGKLAKQILDIKKHFPATDHPLASLPSTPIASKAPWSGEPVTTSLDQVDVVQEEIESMVPTMERPPSQLEPPATPPLTRSGSLEADRGQSEAEYGVRFADQSPTPEELDMVNSPQPGKKKARRGVRGGVKHKKKKSNSKHEQSEAGEEPLADASRIAAELSVDTNIQKVNGSSIVDTSVNAGTVIQIGHLQLDTLHVLGRGSHGTIVYKGSFGGREVAVKRMLLDFYDIASHEVRLLQESDGHPNVVRYYDKESAGDFLYIALELCPASLEEVVQKPENYPTLVSAGGLDMPNVLKQITLGVQYLHSLKIVHRDIKPQNILVTATKMVLSNPGAVQPPRLLISDFGLCKKLEGDQNSFRATTAHAAGTSGWRAPELLVDEDLTTPPSNAPNPNNTQTSGSTSEPAVVDPQTNRRATRAIDIFSLGCVFYYVLTNGNHPFDKDGIYMREANIVKGLYNIDDLQSLGDYQWEAKDLIKSMLAHNPRDRPDATTVLNHPFFWSAEDRLDFLCQVSDRFEFEPRDPPSWALLHLESYAPAIITNEGGDFLRILPREFRDTLGKQRKYNGEKVLDLLRALRNKKNHYEDIPEAVKEKLGGLPRGYLSFWSTRFPNLLMACHKIVAEVGWDGRDRFRKFYGVM